MNKSAWVLLGTVVTVVLLEASKKRAVCNIKGEVHPIKAFRKAWLIQNGDTVPVKRLGSHFQVAVKPGEYGIWIDAIAPYKDQVFHEIKLTDDQVSDLGEIDLFE